MKISLKINLKNHLKIKINIFIDNLTRSFSVTSAKKTLKNVIEEAIFLGEKCSANKNGKFADNEKAILHEFLAIITDGDDDRDAMQKWLKSLKTNILCAKKFENGFSEAETVQKNPENEEDQNRTARLNTSDVKFIEKVEILRKKICSNGNIVDEIGLDENKEILLDEVVNHPSIQERIDAVKIRAGVMGKYFLEKNFDMGFLQFAEAVKGITFIDRIRPF